MIERTDAPTRASLHSGGPLAMAVALLVGAMGCGSDGTGPGGDKVGTGSVQVSGAESLSFSGPAASGTDAITGAPTFGVDISDERSTNNFDVVFTEGRPGPGTYSIGSPDSEVYAELGIGSTLYESFFGEVTITSSSAQSIVGSVTFHGIRLGGAAQVSVSASFHAACIEVPGLFTCD